MQRKVTFSITQLIFFMMFVFLRVWAVDGNFKLTIRLTTPLYIWSQCHYTIFCQVFVVSIWFPPSAYLQWQLPNRVSRKGLSGFLYQEGEQHPGLCAQFLAQPFGSAIRGLIRRCSLFWGGICGSLGIVTELMNRFSKLQQSPSRCNNARFWYSPTVRNAGVSWWWSPLATSPELRGRVWSLTPGFPSWATPYSICVTALCALDFTLKGEY